MAITTQQRQSFLLCLLQLTGLPLGVAALGDTGTVILVGSAVVAGTFVVVFSVLHFATNLLCPKLASPRTTGVRKDGGAITDEDSDSTRSDEEDPTRGDAGPSVEDEASKPSPTLWRSASNRIKALRAPQPQPMEDEETGSARPPTPRPSAVAADPKSDISVNISKLLSDNSKTSFAAMADAFVRNATMGEDVLPRDDDLWSGYSGGSQSQLSVFDDSSCNTQTMELMQRSNDLTNEIPADLSEEAWLEFLEGAVGRHEREGHSKSSLNLSKEILPEKRLCSFDL